MKSWVTIPLLLLCAGCGSYRQNILLTSATPTAEETSAGILRDYPIQPGDLLRIEVYSNRGERLIEPLPELSPSGSNASESDPARHEYRTDAQGAITLPLIGTHAVKGKTLSEAEQTLAAAYAVYFKEPYVRVVNRSHRVIVLGSVGGHVVPLTHPDMTLAEALAHAKGIPNDSKVQNIRIVRGSQVMWADLSTVEGFQKGNLVLAPGDIVYIEPVRRPFSEGLRDNAGVLGLLVSLATLAVVIVNTR